MDLIDAGERSARQDRVGGQAAVGLDGLGSSPLPSPQLSPATAPFDTPPLPPEKSVRHAIERARTDDVEVHSLSLMTMSSSAWVPTMKA